MSTTTLLLIVFSIAVSMVLILAAMVVTLLRGRRVRFSMFDFDLSAPSPPYLRDMPRKEEPLKIQGTMDDALRALLQVPPVKKAKAKKAPKRAPKKK